jgi:hypothetical protein
VAVLLAMVGPLVSAAGVEPVTWSRQFGGPNATSVEDVAVAGSGIYVVGWTVDALPGQAALGAHDAFVRRYDTAGNEVWTRQFGTAEADLGFAVDATSSGVYVAGETSGSLGGTNAGGRDGFLRRFDAAGNEVWTQQFGDVLENEVTAVAATSSAVYVVGQQLARSSGRMDVMVRKFDASGGFVWKQKFGTRRTELANAVSATADAVYVAGTTFGRFPGHARDGDGDSFIRRYGPAGRVVWTRQFGTVFEDGVLGVSAKPLGFFAVGYASHPDGSEAYDGFVRKYDAAGQTRWVRRFGTQYIDFAADVDATETGIYVAGQSVRPNPGHRLDTNNASVRKYVSGGQLSWVRGFGNQRGSTTVAVNGVAATATDLFVGGWTNDALPGHTPSGETDGYLVRMRP